MTIALIQDFIAKIENHDVQSFENEILQFRAMFKKIENIQSVIFELENDFKEIGEKIADFYQKIDTSFNKKHYIEDIKKLIQNNETAEIALGYFLMEQEINRKSIGYFRVIYYWYGCEHGNYNAAKKGFINLIIKPLTGFAESRLNQINA